MKFDATLRIGLLVCGLFLLSSGAKAESTKLRFVGNASLPPMVWNHNGRAEGVAVDLTRALARKAGLHVEIEASEWQLAQDELQEGTIDALLQINASPQRRAVFDFSTPLLQSNFHLFHKNNDLEISDLKSLEGKKVGVESGGYPIDIIRQNDRINVVVTTDSKEAFKLLEAGLIDATLVDRWVGEYILFQYKITDIAIIDPPVFSTDSRIAVRKGNSSLLGKINEGLRAIESDGTRSAILEKWQAKEVVYLTREVIDWTLAGGALTVFLTLMTLSAWLYLQHKKLTKLNTELYQRVVEVTELKTKLSEQASHDPLTGLYNRRHLSKILPIEVSRAKREAGTLSLIMIDLDHFKKVNDSYGHDVGDKVLQTIAQILSENLRASDIVCRYGGEEFLVALPGMTMQQAVERAVTWQESIRKAAIRHDNLVIAMTFSAGISTFPQDGTDVDELITKADQAMYHSKHHGRNRVTCFKNI